MNQIRIKCPAKINLTLEVVNKRQDGFHNIKSVMQMISLYDFLTIKVTPATENIINLSGNCEDIPYDERNLVYKAAQIFLNKAQIEKTKIEIYLDKNIPLSAGLAGGSTDAAGTLYGLNKLFEKPLSHEELEALCAQLGSDLNVCLNGGCVLATSRGEVTQKLPNVEYPVTLIKPKNLGISAGEAYKKYSLKEVKPQNNMTEKIIQAIKDSKSILPYLYNDLEYAVFDDYKELQEIKSVYGNSVMSGSGSTYFVLENIETSTMNDDYQIISGLHFISEGVSIS